MGIDSDYNAFDEELTMLINGRLMALHQLGVGPKDIFSITGNSEEWSEFSEDANVVSAAKMYVYCKVKLIFDPPSSSSASEAVNKQADEYEWRLSIHREDNGTTL